MRGEAYVASASDRPEPKNVERVDLLLEEAMSRFWDAPGGNMAGVRAVLEFALAHERDACAKLAADNSDNDSRGDSPWDNGAGSSGYRTACYDLEEAIKARGKPVQEY